MAAVGSWGAGVFSDDLALDVRAAWRDALLEGLDAGAATERVAAGFTAFDEAEAATAWIALAAAQHETGHLRTEVRERALAAIASDAGTIRAACRPVAS
jgi:hypothetical protein